MTGQLLGPNTSLAIGQVVPNTATPQRHRPAGDGIANTNYTWPTVGYAPRFGAAYDLTGGQKFVLRGGAGLFFDRPNGNTVFTQVGNPPSRPRRPSATRSCRTSAAAGWRRRAAALVVFKYDAKLPSSFQWNAGVQMALPWASLDVSYVGQHGYNLLQNVDINSVDFGTAFRRGQDPTLAASTTPGASALSIDLLRPYRGFGAIQQNWSTAGTRSTRSRRRSTGGSATAVVRPELHAGPVATPATPAFRCGWSTPRTAASRSAPTRPTRMSC